MSVLGLFLFYYVVGSLCRTYLGRRGRTAFKTGVYCALLCARHPARLLTAHCAWHLYEFVEVWHGRPRSDDVEMLAHHVSAYGLCLALLWTPRLWLLAARGCWLHDVTDVVLHVAKASVGHADAIQITLYTALLCSWAKYRLWDFGWLLWRAPPVPAYAAAIAWGLYAMHWYWLTRMLRSGYRRCVQRRPFEDPVLE